MEETARLFDDVGSSEQPWGYGRKTIGSSGWCGEACRRDGRAGGKGEVACCLPSPGCRAGEMVKTLALPPTSLPLPLGLLDSWNREQREEKKNPPVPLLKIYLTIHDNVRRTCLRLLTSLEQKEGIASQ